MSSFNFIKIRPTGLQSKSEETDGQTQLAGLPLHKRIPKLHSATIQVHFEQKPQRSVQEPE